MITSRVVAARAGAGWGVRSAAASAVALQRWLLADLAVRAHWQPRVAGSSSAVRAFCAAADASPTPVVAPPATGAPKESLQSNIIFDHAIKNLTQKYGGGPLVFPKEIIWLAGAPGAGKGTMGKFIVRMRGITADPLETSSLFNNERAKALKDQGRLLGDLEVVETVLEELLKPQYAQGVLVDGYPRTVIQAECIKLLKDYMIAQRASHMNDPILSGVLRRPQFHITVLYVEEEESVRRQLARGKEVSKRSRIAKEVLGETGEESRTTDQSEELARVRYREFKDQVVKALAAIKSHFFFHFIDAHGTPADVEAAIQREFRYQSSLELGDETFALVRTLKNNEEVVAHARQKMVQRLNTYTRQYSSLFQQVIQLLQEDFMHIIEVQALAGRAIIRSNSPLLQQPMAVNMALDVLAERGFRVTLDIVRQPVPRSLDPYVPGTSSPQQIRHRTLKSYVFTVEFPPPTIRDLEH